MARKVRIISSQITVSTEIQSLALIIELLRTMPSWDRKRVVAAVNTWFDDEVV